MKKLLLIVLFTVVALVVNAQGTGIIRRPGYYVIGGPSAETNLLKSLPDLAWQKKDFIDNGWLNWTNAAFQEWLNKPRNVWLSQHSKYWENDYKAEVEKYKDASNSFNTNQTLWGESGKVEYYFGNSTNISWATFTVHTNTDDITYSHLYNVIKTITGSDGFYDTTPKQRPGQPQSDRMVPYPFYHWFIRGRHSYSVDLFRDGKYHINIQVQVDP